MRGISERNREQSGAVEFVTNIPVLYAGRSVEWVWAGLVPLFRRRLLRVKIYSFEERIDKVEAFEAQTLSRFDDLLVSAAKIYVRFSEVIVEVLRFASVIL